MVGFDHDRQKNVSRVTNLQRFRAHYESNPFGFDDDEGDCDDNDYEDEWDRQWNRKHEKEEVAKNEEAADVLDVELDATPAEIKRVY